MTTVVDASVALRWCFQLKGSDRAEQLFRSNDHFIAPDLVMAEITNAAWKFVLFDGVSAESAQAAVRDFAKAFEELVPTSVLKDRALAIAIQLRHPNGFVLLFGLQVDAIESVLTFFCGRFFCRTPGPRQHASPGQSMAGCGREGVTHKRGRPPI